MARTMTVNKGGGGGANYSEGWKTLTISRAAYGVFNDAKYLDVWLMEKNGLWVKSSDLLMQELLVV